MSDITDCDVAKAMIIYSCGFVAELGKGWQIANDDNKSRLRTAFPEYWLQYRELARRRAAEANS